MGKNHEQFTKSKPLLKMQGGEVSGELSGLYRYPGGNASI